VKAAETSLEVLQKRVPLTIARAQADLDHAVAVAASADSTEGVLRKEYERAQELHKDNAIAKEELDQKQLAFLSASNDLTAARAAVERARKARAESELGYDDVKRLRDEIAALRAKHSKALAAVEQRGAERAASLAALDEAQSTLDDLTITAPTAGTVVSRMVDQGEVVPAGAPLFDVVDLDRLYLQVYVPEPEIGKVRLDNKARIHTDAFPDKPFDATVRYIASEAEFTPKEVQTVEERVKLVYAVRLYLDENVDHRLTPGLPADAVIRWDPDAPWMKPRW
jgi:HlyD family secretion protein